MATTIKTQPNNNDETNVSAVIVTLNYNILVAHSSGSSMSFF